MFWFGLLVNEITRNSIPSSGLWPGLIVAGLSLKPITCVVFSFQWEKSCLLFILKFNAMPFKFHSQEFFKGVEYAFSIVMRSSILRMK